MNDTTVLNLHAEETITACWPAMMMRDFGACVHCQEPAFRVVQITNHFGQRRYISLCGDQFMRACMLFPDLIEVDIRGVLAHAVS
jgi:hypothetical protein